MDTKARAAAYGIAGLALAGIMIFSGTALGVLGPAGGLNLGSPGSVSILLTDPPSVPEGVSAVYISYSDLSLHVAGLGDSGWVTVGRAGTVETLGLVNLSQTISTGNAPSGRYNLLAFNITAVKVTFNNVNYSARVSSGRLVVPFTGGLTVNASTPAAALVDIQPTVLNIGSESSPNFVIAAGARALQFPSDEVGQSLAHVGYKTSLEGKGWFHSFKSSRSDNLTFSALFLSANSFSFSASNPGEDPVAIRMVILTAASAGVRPESMPSSLSSSTVFAINADGSLHLLTAGPGERANPGDVNSALGSAGYQLSAGASKVFSYSGTISTFLSKEGIVSGATYYVLVVGSHTISLETVKAA